MEDTVLTFLHRNALHPDTIDTEETLAAFLARMEAGLAADRQVLAMIPTYVPCDITVEPGEPVLVLDAGGTNLRVCVLRFAGNGSHETLHFQKHPMPGIQNPLSRTEFFRTIADYIGDAVAGVDRIGFCFSYPTEITPERDGRLLRWTKEVQVPELVGEYVGRGLVDVLAARGAGRKRCVVLNDTVAALLAGKAVGDARQCEGNVGFILGTGTNVAYVEANARIAKRPGLPGDRSQIINCESGNFDAAPRGPVDVALDRRSATPGAQLLEKMIGGAYLGSLCGHALVAAAGAGLLSPALTPHVESWCDLTTVTADNFAHNPYGRQGALAAAPMTETDRLRIWNIIDTVLARAAKLSAINMAAAVLKGSGGASPLHPACVNIDGSTFYKTHAYARRVFQHLDRILLRRERHYLHTHVDNAPVIGAAIAAFC